VGVTAMEVSQDDGSLALGGNTLATYFSAVSSACGEARRWVIDYFSATTQGETVPVDQDDETRGAAHAFSGQ